MRQIWAPGGFPTKGLGGFLWSAERVVIARCCSPKRAASEAGRSRCTSISESGDALLGLPFYKLSRGSNALRAQSGPASVMAFFIDPSKSPMQFEIDKSSTPSLPFTSPIMHALNLSVLFLQCLLHLKIRLPLFLDPLLLDISYHACVHCLQVEIYQLLTMTAGWVGRCVLHSFLGQGRDLQLSRTAERNERKR